MLDRESMELGQVVGDLPGMCTCAYTLQCIMARGGYVHAHGVGLETGA